MKENGKQTLGEEIANAISHGLMAIFGIVGMILLIIKANTTVEVIAAVIFGFGMILLYLMSTLFHALKEGRAKNLFQRFDHLSIYILIGGTFAPVLLLLEGLREPLFEGFISKGLTLFIIQWTLILVGVIFKSIWIKKFAKLHIFIYLLMGWSALTFIGVLLESSKEAFLLILLGGIAYSVGVIFYSLGRIKYFHFIWHIFTALGTILQFLAIYNYIY
ncbi:PAQR family membrane homeostasis protein TrhA [Haploplasma modicum]|uniref:PAQR family membrane homeostasis protein TrhA n=1 Tax=Haploplasma modicum TaxID=2150 RepID=UPI00214AF47A|nr:hemolysin III family protein [Haploplasma modicum]MCR1809213.1 hemolysin III family protein [Haploplasma modicum]